MWLRFGLALSFAGCFGHCASGFTPSLWPHCLAMPLPRWSLAALLFTLWFLRPAFDINMPFSAGSLARGTSRSRSVPSLSGVVLSSPRYIQFRGCPSLLLSFSALSVTASRGLTPYSSDLVLSPCRHRSGVSLLFVPGFVRWPSTCLFFSWRLDRSVLARFLCCPVS